MSNVEDMANFEDSMNTRPKGGLGYCYANQRHYLSHDGQIDIVHESKRKRDDSISGFGVGIQTINCHDFSAQ